MTKRKRQRIIDKNLNDPACESVLENATQFADALIVMGKTLAENGSDDEVQSKHVGRARELLFEGHDASNQKKKIGFTFANVFLGIGISGVLFEMSGTKRFEYLIGYFIISIIATVFTVWGAIGKSRF